MSFHADIVRESFRSLKTTEESVASRFYQLLFETYPEMRRLLPALAPGNLERTTAEALKLALEHLHEPETLGRHLAPYARRLRQNGVRHVHFAALGETWLRTLAVMHRDRWSGELSRQWLLAFQLTAKALRKPEPAPYQDVG